MSKTIGFWFLLAVSSWVVAQDQGVTPPQGEVLVVQTTEDSFSGPVCCGFYSQPICVRKVFPVYPQRGWVSRQRAEVVLRANVSPKGELGEVRVIQGLGHDSFGFETEAVAAFKRYRFLPAKLINKPVWSRVTIRFCFDPWPSSDYLNRAGSWPRLQAWLYRRHRAAQRKAAH